MTRRNNRTVIEDALATASPPMPRFEYTDLPRPCQWLKRRLGHPGLLAYYYLWQIALGIAARRLHRAVGFDIAHHVTFVNDSLPSGLCVLPIPFIWGPVGGSTHVLPDTIDWNSPRMPAGTNACGRLCNCYCGSSTPFLALTRRRADLILVYTHEALDGLIRSASASALVAVVHIGSQRG